MERWLPYAAAMALVAAGVWIFLSRCHIRKIMEQLSHMLEAAEEGSFRESVYDESMLSSIEIKMAHYLNASGLAADELIREREKVKQLIADISHQTKTPIANLLLYAQMLEEKELSKENREFVQEINRQAQKLNFLIAALIKASRLETEMFVLHPEWNRISPMLEEVIDQVAVRAKCKRQTISFSPDDTCAWFDRKWTTEAIYNIVDNAVKYTPDGGNIAISLVHMELFARIEISDTGMGIEEAETAKIFRRFYRGSSACGEEGIGLGLYLAREILTEEHGYMKVASTAGQGSSFYVYLPLKSNSDIRWGK